MYAHMSSPFPCLSQLLEIPSHNPWVNPITLDTVIICLAYMADEGSALQVVLYFLMVSFPTCFGSLESDPFRYSYRDCRDYHVTVTNSKPFRC